jgi:hypothetical protein
MYQFPGKYSARIRQVLQDVATVQRDRVDGAQAVTSQDAPRGSLTRGLRRVARVFPLVLTRMWPRDLSHGRGHARSCTRPRDPT